jgi:hypothetical protein
MRNSGEEEIHDYDEPEKFKTTTFWNLYLIDIDGEKKNKK